MPYRSLLAESFEGSANHSGSSGLFMSSLSTNSIGGGRNKIGSTSNPHQKSSRSNFSGVHSFMVAMLALSSGVSNG